MERDQTVRVKLDTEIGPWDLKQIVGFFIERPGTWGFFGVLFAERLELLARNIREREEKGKGV